jgi:hypothetical protein
MTNVTSDIVTIRMLHVQLNREQEMSAQQRDSVIEVTTVKNTLTPEQGKSLFG